jgi:hypothetical protein
MPLVGNLRDFALHDFLYLVDRGYKTGSLILRSKNDSAALYFDQGKLAAVTRPQRHERLGEILIRAGKVTRAQLSQALADQEATQTRPIGKILMEQGAISADDLQTFVQTVVENTVYDLFTWHEGEFEFKADLAPAPDEIQTPVPIDVENLIMEGVRRVDELTRIRERIPHDGMIVRLTDRANDPKTDANLTADEWRIFARIDNRTTINELAEKLQLSPFEVSSIVFGLIVSGLVVVAEPGARPMTAAGHPLAQATKEGGSADADDPADTDAESNKPHGMGRFFDRLRGS